MSVSITNIALVGPTCTKWDAPFSWEISLECIQELAADLEFKIIYVGSAEDEKLDQVLDSSLVGPIPIGALKFVLQADCPDKAKIPATDAVGVTCLLLTCSYIGQEFIRVGYFVNNEYENEDLKLNPPSKPDFSRIVREVLVDKPRVTRYPIDWCKTPSAAVDVDGLQEDIVMYNTNSCPMPDANSQSNDGSTWEQAGTPGRNLLEVLTASLNKQILRCLDIDEIARCRRVSKQWKNIIDSGVELKRIDLTDFEWGQRNPNGILNFALTQSSVELESLELAGCNIVTDQIFHSWITKCGKTLRTIDIDYCPQLTMVSVQHILQNCPRVEALMIAEIAGLEGDFLHQIIANYGTTLQRFSLSNISGEGLRFLGNSIGKQLTHVSIPGSNTITDALIEEFIALCPNLRELTVVFCRGISCATVEKLRAETELEVIASHTPDDFSVEILADDKMVLVVFYLQGTRQTVPLEDLPTDLLPQGLTQHGHSIYFAGNPKELEAALEEAGFSEVQTALNGDWEEDLEDEEEDESEDNDEEGVEEDEFAPIENLMEVAPKRQKVLHA